MIKMQLVAETGIGVDIFSPLGILILTIGLFLTVGLPLFMIKFGRKDQ